MDDRRLSLEGFALAACKFKALADPMRLRILDALRYAGELTVGDVAERLQCSQPTASRQLSKLFDAHMVERRRENNSVHYYVEDESIFELCESVCGRLEREASDQLGLLYTSPKEVKSE